jgi:hypothetical protein
MTQQRSQQVKALGGLFIAAAICLVGLVPTTAYAKHAAIDVAGSWSLAVSSGDLIAGAGSDLNGTYDSPADQVAISITQRVGAWSVASAISAGGGWNGSLTLWVRRSSSGSGGGTVQGGLSYQMLDAVSREFFTGTDDKIGIGVQLRLTGMSVQIPDATYSCSVVYTVSDR